MPILRTPDERFRHLPGYSFPLHYLTIDGARMQHTLAFLTAHPRP